MPKVDADALAGALVRRLLCDEPGFAFLEPRRGESVAILVNNLGTTTPMEIAVVARAAIRILEEEHGLDVGRVFAGSFMTSLDMAGVSLSLMRLDALRTARIDAPAQAPAWPVAGGMRHAHKAPIPSPLHDVMASVEDGATRAHAPSVRAAVAAACKAVIGMHEQLDEWDRIVGDGDCGQTLKTGAEAMLRLVSAAEEESLSNAGRALRLLGEGAEAMGGSSGALYNIAFTAAAGEAQQNAQEEGGAPFWARALEAGIQAMSRYGGAVEGSWCVAAAAVCDGER